MSTRTVPRCVLKRGGSSPSVCPRSSVRTCAILIGRGPDFGPGYALTSGTPRLRLQSRRAPTLSPCRTLYSVADSPLLRHARTCFAHSSFVIFTPNLWTRFLRFARGPSCTGYGCSAGHCGRRARSIPRSRATRQLFSCSLRDGEGPPYSGTAGLWGHRA